MSETTAPSPARSELATRLNWLRASVLGANDGILSTAGIVLGVSGAAVGPRALLAAGLAGMIAGALSMAAGEYVSVSTQRDTERAQIGRIRSALAQSPGDELDALTDAIAADGVDRNLALAVAQNLSEKDPVDAHAKFRFGIDPDSLTNPWHAALASMISFAIGALIPLLAIVLDPESIAVPVTVVMVTLALAITGSVSARLGDAPVARATIRNILGGLLAMGVTYAIGVGFAHIA